MTYYLIKLLQWIWDSKNMLLAMLAAIMYWAGLAKDLVVAGFNKMLETFSALDPDALDQANFSAIDFIGVGNAIFPFEEMCAMLVIYYVLWSNLILLRWIKSFIPTISN